MTLLSPTKHVFGHFSLYLLIHTYQVHDEEMCKDDARAEHRGEQHVRLPFLPPKTLVDPKRNMIINIYIGILDADKAHFFMVPTKNFMTKLGAKIPVTPNSLWIMTTFTNI